MMANNKDFLKEIIRGKPKSLVAKSSDYITVQTTLDELTDPDKTSFRPAFLDK